MKIVVVGADQAKLLELDVALQKPVLACIVDGVVYRERKDVLTEHRDQQQLTITEVVGNGR